MRACELEGWTTREFAEQAGIACAELEAFLAGDGLLSVATLRQACVALGLAPWDLLSHRFDPMADAGQGRIRWRPPRDPADDRGPHSMSEGS